MRVTRSILLILAAAFAVAGCAAQPAPRLAVAPPPPPPGIDNMIYGPVAPPMPRPAPIVGRGIPGTVIVAAPARVAAVPALPLAYAPPQPELPYTLDSGDRLRIVVFGQDGLSNSYLVDAGGHIAMPLIGSVLARGATTEQLSSRIAEKLRQGFIRDPHVAVEVEAYRPFFILGEVTQPGQYPYVADMTVETAVAIAGGFTARAFRRTVVVTRIVNGQQLRVIVPITTPLRPGDTVNVQERWF